MIDQPWLTGTLASGAAVAVVALKGLSLYSRRPVSGLGVYSGKLARCPWTLTCVASCSSSGLRAMAPIPFQGDSVAAIESLTTVLKSMPRCRVLAADDGYVHAEFESRLLRFVDDVEFLIDPDGKQIHFRSASRVGFWDMEINRLRMRRIRDLFADSHSIPASE